MAKLIPVTEFLLLRYVIISVSAIAISAMDLQIAIFLVMEVVTIVTQSPSYPPPQNQ
jgi:predicted peroxiredoxin